VVCHHASANFGCAVGEESLRNTGLMSMTMFSAALDKDTDVQCGPK
jgi:aminopeptidase C